MCPPCLESASVNIELNPVESKSNPLASEKTLVDDFNDEDDNDGGGNDDVAVRRPFGRLQKESGCGQDYPCTR